MAPIEDGPTTRTPLALVLAAGLLFCLRLGGLAVEAAHPRPEAPRIAWQALGDPALAKAPAGRRVLYKFYADWSEPCKRLERTVFVSDQVSALVRDGFTPVAVRDRLREDGKNAEAVTELQKRLRVFAFPTLVVVDESGRRVGAMVGCPSTLATYRFLSRARTEKVSD